MIPNTKYQRHIYDCAEELHENIKIREGTFLISGGTGLIGSAIIDCLLLMNDEFHTNFKVVALAKGRERAAQRFGEYFDRSDFQFEACDVNEALSDMGEIAYVIHAASNTHPRAYSGDPIGTIRTNVVGTENLLKYAAAHGCKRFVFLSSVEIYGENRGEAEKFGEADLGYLDCNSLRAGYPESKRLGESLCCAYAAVYGTDIVIPRLCRVYGPTMWEDDSKALAQFIRKAAKGEDIILKSQGTQYFSYVHVIDAVKAVFWILDKGKSGEAYNVASQLSDITLLDLAQKLAKIAGTKVVFQLPEKEEEKGYSSATRAVLDNEKLRELGWKENFCIDEGLRTTVEILREMAENFHSQKL